MTESSSAVSIADLKKLPEPRQFPAVTPGFGDLQSFELMQRGAKVLSQSTLVPKEYQGAEGLPNAIVALNMALRMQADPLMVMQNLYVVHGRPAWSAQFLIAAFNRCGRYSALRYEWQGKRGDKEWGCRAWAIERETGERVTGPLVTMATAEAEGWIARTGSKWKTIPELMLTYRAAAWMVRTNAPEIAMGLPTTDEADDVVTLTRDQYTVEQVKAGEHAESGADKRVSVPPGPIGPAGPNDPKGGPTGAPFRQHELVDGELRALPNDDLMPPPTLADSIVAIRKAKDHDELDVIMDAARGTLKDPQQNAEFDVEARARRKALGER